MKKVLFVLMAIGFVASLAFAQDATVAVKSDTITIKGDIIDNMCAGTQKAEDLANFVKTHTKECALMQDCVESGYSIFADGKLSKFTKDSNSKIEEFLKKTDSKLQVIVTVKQAGDELELVSIENQG